MASSARAVVVRTACAGCAVVAAAVAVLAGNDLYFAGFPDSHFTDYDRAAQTPKRILMWLEWAFVLVFLLLAILPVNAKARTAALFAGVVALALAVIAQWVLIPWYFITHLGLDTGIGG